MLRPRTAITTLLMVADAGGATSAKVDFKLLHNHNSLLSIFPIDSTTPALCCFNLMCYTMRIGRIIGSCYGVGGFDRCISCGTLTSKVYLYPQRSPIVGRPKHEKICLICVWIRCASQCPAGRKAWDATD